MACLGGSFYVQDGLNSTYGYGVYDNTRTTWVNAGGYLPALVSTFRRGGAEVSITNFGDELSVGGNRFVAVYSRVAVRNPTLPVEETNTELVGALPATVNGTVPAVMSSMENFSAPPLADSLAVSCQSWVGETIDA